MNSAFLRRLSFQRWIWSSSLTKCKLHTFQNLNFSLWEQKGGEKRVLLLINSEARDLRTHQHCQVWKTQQLGNAGRRCVAKRGPVWGPGLGLHLAKHIALLQSGIKTWASPENLCLIPLSVPVSETGVGTRKGDTSLPPAWTEAQLCFFPLSLPC